MDTELLRLVEGNELMRLVKGMCMPMVHVMLNMVMIGHDFLEAYWHLKSAVSVGPLLHAFQF